MGKLRINMLGADFTIQATEEPEYLEKLLGYYKRITDDVKNIPSIKTPLQVAILSGIMIVDELYKEKEEKIKMENGTYVPAPQQESADSEEVERRTLNMIEKISKVL